MTQEMQTEYSDIYEIHEPRSIPAGRGAGWLRDGFGYFRQAPGQWVAICVVGFMIMIGINFIPFVGIFAGILTPVWSAGLLLGCKALHEGRPLEIQHLFAGFGDKVVPLILSGLLVSCISLLLIAVLFGSVFLQLINGNAEAVVASDNGMMMAIRILVLMALMIPVYAAIWFSPALIVLGDFGVIESLRLSLVAGLRNILPLIVYGLVIMLLMIPVTLTLGLGMLIVGPMVFASIFISFREIFVE